MTTENSMRKLCLKLNKDIQIEKLALFTWGNASIRTSKTNFLIKPSGVNFEKLQEDMLVEVNMYDGQYKSELRPSVDTLFHAEIYKAFPDVGGVLHTHSTNATAFAQAKIEIPLLGTTHADYFPRSIPVADQITINENEKMETTLGVSIVECVKSKYPDNVNVRAVLMPCHGVILLAKDPALLIEYSIVLEEIAALAIKTQLLNSAITITSQDQELFNFHYGRKHGGAQYYGQSLR